MSEHDVTQSSNPDVQALLRMLTQVGRSVIRLREEVAAIRGELASLPQAYVVPGPQGEIPNGTVVSHVAGSDGAGGASQDGAQ